LKPNSDGSGSKIFMARVGSGQIFVARVGSAIYGLGLNWENFPPKHQIFQFFPFGSKSTRVKGGLPSYLLRIKSKLGSGQGPPSLKPKPKMADPIQAKKTDPTKGQKILTRTHH